MQQYGTITYVFILNRVWRLKKKRLIAARKYPQTPNAYKHDGQNIHKFEIVFLVGHVRILSSS